MGVARLFFLLYDSFSIKLNLKKEKRKNNFLINIHLICDHNGNENKRNRLNQTSLHCLLQSGNEVRRNECLTLLLKWKEKHTNETIDIDAKDSVIEYSNYLNSID